LDAIEGPTVLTYPQVVSNVIQTSTLTAIPYITQYDNGTNITSYSTVYHTDATLNTAPTTTNLTWTTLGTTLTFPTTYLAFPSLVAGVSKQFTGANSFCYASLAAVRLGNSDLAHLIFPSSTPADHDRITASVGSILDSLPTISAMISPYKPSQCSQFVGSSQVPAPTSVATNAPASSASSSVAATNVGSAPAVTHTSVRFLTTQGQAVITRVSAEEQTTNGPSTPGNTSGGKSTSTPQPGTTSRPGTTSQPGTTPKPAAVLSVGSVVVTAGPSGAFNIGGGKTLTPGGTAVVGGTTVSLAAGGSVAVLNGQTSTLGTTAGGVGGAINSGLAGPQASSGAGKALTSGCAVGLFGLFVGVFL